MKNIKVWHAMLLFAFGFILALTHWSSYQFGKIAGRKAGSYEGFQECKRIYARPLASGRDCYSTVMTWCERK